MAYAPLHPFTPNARFKVVRPPVTLDGKDYTYDEELPADTNERLLELLYTQRRIEVIGPKEDIPLARPEAQKAKAAKKAEPKVEPETAPEKAAPKYTVKQAGLGGFKVISPSGAPVGPGHKTHAEAMTEADRLNALEA